MYKEIQDLHYTMCNTELSEFLSEFVTILSQFYYSNTLVAIV